MPELTPDEMDRLVSKLLRGRRLSSGGMTPDDAAAVLAAARLAGARESRPRMSPSLRRSIVNRLERSGRSGGGGVSRRSALAGAAAMLAGAVAGGAAVRLTGLGEDHRDRALPSGDGGRRVEPVNGRWHPVAALSSLPEGRAVFVEAGAVLAYVFRRGEAVTAVSAICSHLPCRLDWSDADHRLNCACHNRSFDPFGEPDGDAYYPLPPLSQVRVRVVAGSVEVLGT